MITSGDISGGRSSVVGGPISRLGARKAVLVDLSPAATFIAYNYNTPVDVAAFEGEARRILGEVEAECGWMYETWHPHCDDPQRIKGRINYTVWSDVFVCPNCGTEMVFWDVAVDKAKGEVRDVFPCPKCGAEHSKRTVERSSELVYDGNRELLSERNRQVPVLINYSVGTVRRDKVPDAEDAVCRTKAEALLSAHWYPRDRMMHRPKGDRVWGDEWRPGRSFQQVSELYTPRSLATLASLLAWTRQVSPATTNSHLFTLTGILINASRMYRWRANQKGGTVSGTYYLPSTPQELNVIEAYRSKASGLRQVFEHPPYRGQQRQVVSTQSSASIPNLPASSVDYIFVDPPFGGNLMYSELNFVWEAWLQIFTDNVTEAIINATQRKGLLEYQGLMEKAFSQFQRILKPGRWMTVEFHNTQNAVWNAIQEAILRAGFMVADVRSLDKGQSTFKQVTSAGAVKQDLVISAYKPTAEFEARFAAEAGTVDGAWDFVKEHLGYLPLPGVKDGKVQVLAERQPYLLFDRMVAFHIQRGLTVPLGAAEFYAGLRRRFDERDGMLFLPDQALAYDALKLTAPEVEQLPLIITDEKTALTWLRQALGRAPSTYQDLQPRFLRELHKAGYELMPELRAMLEESFLQDDQGRWCVPDPGRAQDLERLREKTLLKEFETYIGGRGRLKTFRGEAVRAGFRAAWRDRDYTTIVALAERLPERVLQEDPDLLMYYDNAALRIEQARGA